jgi:TRAP-type C4-dicarboxylate transport system permease small subunit
VEKAYQLWRAFQDRILARVAALLLIGCTLLALAEIFRRYVLGFSFEWQQDAVTFFILSGVYLYFSVSQRHGEHLGVTVVVEVLDVMGPRARRAAEIIRLIALVISFLFMAAVVWWGVPEVLDSHKYETRTESLAFSMWPFLAVLLAGFSFMVVTLFFQIYRAVQALRGRAVAADRPGEDAGALHLTR